MLRVDDYVRQAQLNADLIPALPLERFDWQITACFYTSLHWLNAVTRRMGKPEARNHTQTFQNIREARLPPAIRDAYEDLYHSSILARYECALLETLEPDALEAKALLEEISVYAKKLLGLN